jgi:hypothetical protein
MNDLTFDCLFCPGMRGGLAEPTVRARPLVGLPCCRQGRKCKDRRPEHMARFVHPCPFGKSCVWMNTDPEWGWQHFRGYYHGPAPYLDETGASVGTAEALNLLSV